MRILNIYTEYFKKNKLIANDSQIKIMEELTCLHHFIDDYKKNRANKLISLFKKIEVPKGLYIYGSVGIGKSMLAELFFKNVNLEKKRQVNFHKFMLEIHQQIHEARNANNKTIDKLDLIKEIAKNLSAKYRLLYIDELEIQDIADAMIVGRLFRELFQQNIMIVTTSNRMPDDLYKDGLQRELFLGFIKLIKEKMNIIELTSRHDYRTQKTLSLKQTFFYPLGWEADEFLKLTIANITKHEKMQSKVLIINKRELVCQNSCGELVYFTFEELFKKPLSNQDFIALCNNFKIIVIANIPKLFEEDREEARRFINFIDTLYAHKTILICTCEVPAKFIYEEGKGIFEFERTVSRLIEMQSEEYLQ